MGLLPLAIEKAEIFGNPNIGVYVFANNELALVPPGVEEDFVRLLTRILRVSSVVRTRIGDTSLPGVMVAGNDKGILLPRTAREEEVKEIRKSFSGNVSILRAAPNALGNIIAANSRAAMVYEELDSEAVKVVRDALEVEVVERGRIAGLVTVGSAVVITNRGGVVHPEAGQDEIERLSNIFGVSIESASVNFGVFFVRSGIVANDRGVLVGSRTTGPEILRITRVLGGDA